MNSEDDFLSRTSAAYEKVLNETAKDGWDFVKADTLTFIPTESNLNLKQSVAENNVTKILIFKKPALDYNEHQTEINFHLNAVKPTCPSCHNEVSADDLFCENCAYKLK